MAVIDIDVYVPDIATVIGLFDVLEVHRSENGENGDYEEITAAAAAAATLLGTEQSPFTLNGLTFLIEVDEGSEQSLSFVTADPISVDDTVDAMNDGLSDVTASEDNGAVRLTSDITGTGSTLEITGGTSLTELGFTTEKVNGQEERLALSAGTSEYSMQDKSGDRTFFYKSRFRNSVSGAVSSFSTPVQGGISSIIASANLVKASIEVAEIDGSPVEGMRIAIKNAYASPANVISGIGVLGQGLIIETDAAGYAETMLVEGSILDVSFAGTMINRRITVPDADFDLLTAISTADDIFQIHTPNIPAAVRRS